MTMWKSPDERAGCNRAAMPSNLCKPRPFHAGFLRARNTTEPLLHNLNTTAPQNTMLSQNFLGLA